MGLRDEGFIGLRVYDLGFRIRGLGYGVQGVGLRAMFGRDVRTVVQTSDMGSPRKRLGRGWGSTLLPFRQELGCLTLPEPGSQNPRARTLRPMPSKEVSRCRVRSWANAE